MNKRTWQQLATTLKQPQWVAVILSVGAHGALFAAGPSFSSLNMNALGGDVPEQERRQVPLIELSPEEQSRLPDFSSSAYSLFPEESDPFALFPPSGSSLPLNPLPNNSATPEPLAPRPNPSPGNSSVAVGIAPYTPPARRPSIMFPPRRSPFTTPLPNSNPTFSNGVPVPRVERTPSATPGATPSTPSPVDPDGYDGPTAADLALNNPQAQPEGDLSSPLSPGNGDNGAAAPNSLQARLAALAYRPENTTEAEAEEALETWQTALEERLPGQLENAAEPIEMQLPYVQRLCLDPEPNDGLLGLLALPTEEGDDLELYPSVLKSTGYPFLNQEAIAALNDLKAPAADAAPEAAPPRIEPGVLYQVVVDVEYDQETCINREAVLEEIKANQEAPATPEEPPAPSQPRPSQPRQTAPAEDAEPTPRETAPAEDAAPEAEDSSSAEDLETPPAEE